MPVIEHEVILQKIFSKNAWSQCKYLYLNNKTTKILEKWLIKSAVFLLIDMVNSNAHNCLWEKSYSLFGVADDAHGEMTKNVEMFKI